MPGTTAVDARHGGPALAADAAVAPEQAAGAAGAAGGAGPTDTSGAAATEQPRVAAGAAILAGRTGAAGAAVADQDAAVGAVGPAAGCAVGAVADDGTAQQRLGGCVDQSQHVAFEDLQGRDIGGFGTGIGQSSAAQRLGEPLMKLPGLDTECLIGAGMRGEQGGHRRRNLIRAGGLQHGRRQHRRGIGCVERGVDACQFCRRRCQ